MPGSNQPVSVSAWTFSSIAYRAHRVSARDNLRDTRHPSWLATNIKGACRLCPRWPAARAARRSC